MSKKEERQDVQPPAQAEAVEGAEPQELSAESADAVVGGMMTAGLSAGSPLRSAAPPVCISQS